MRTPASLAVVPLVIGSGLALILDERLPALLPICAAGAALLALAAAAVSVAFGDAPEASMAIVLGCLFAGVSLGTDAAKCAYHSSLIEWYGLRASPAAPAILEGVLREDAARTPFGASLSLDIQRAGELHEGAGSDRKAASRPRAWSLIASTSGAERRAARASKTSRASLHEVSGGARVSVSGVLATARLSEWRAGRTLRVTAVLRPPAFYLDPGVRDERRALARRDVMLVGSVKSGALVEVAARGPRTLEIASAVRAWTRSAVAASIGRWSARSAGIAGAILLGDRTGLSEEDVRRLQEAGTYHVIAISGGNIAILTTLLFGVLRAVRLPSRASSALTIVCLLVYDQIVVTAPSVERAIAAAVVYLTARILDHRASALNVLAVAALLGLAVAPVTLLEPGFLLSFGATLGILLIVHRIAVGRGPATIGRLTLTVLGTMLASTAAAEVALTPIGAVIFGRVTFAGLLLNFAAIPLMSVVQAATLAAVALSAIEPDLALSCGWVAHAAATALVDSARLVDVASWTHREVTAPSWSLIAAYYASLVVALARISPTIRHTSTALAGVAGALIVIAPAWTSQDAAPPPSGPVRLVFLDVGQGDATVVLLPGGRTMLIDAGGVPSAPPVLSADDDGRGFDVGGRIVGPALRALGVRRLETLTITHGDPDHIGGAPTVLRQFAPRTIWEGVPVPPHQGLQALVAAANSGGIVWRTLRVGDEERAGGVTIRVLHPPAPDWERQRVRNEDSVVLELRTGDVSVILPGDIGREGELAILSLLRPAPLVVLKAPHHGSATSSTPELLDRLRPDAVVFSAGRLNQFGHPHPAVVARYRAIGARLFSTAADGAVILETDGRNVRIRTWTGRSETLTAARSSR